MGGYGNDYFNSNATKRDDATVSHLGQCNKYNGRNAASKTILQLNSYISSKHSYLEMITENC